MDPDKIRAGGGKFQMDNESDHISMVCPSLPQWIDSWIWDQDSCSSALWWAL